MNPLPPPHALSPPWPHAPTHLLAENGTYMVTSGTYLKQHFFRNAERLAVVQRGLLKVLAEGGWRLEAWAVFSNHYHFVAHSPDGKAAAFGLSDLLRELHSKLAIWINRLDRIPQRKVWHNFWDTRLTHQPSYLARLNYVHENAVRHGLVACANQYPWCSAGWFENTSPAAKVKSIYRFKTDQVAISDEYEPSGDWRPRGADAIPPGPGVWQR